MKSTVLIALLRTICPELLIVDLQLPSAVKTRWILGLYMHMYSTTIQLWSDKMEVDGGFV